MEVHHHHRDMTGKNLKEYFLEFVMIFLAVTLGFIAENIREHFSDKDHAHQLTAQLLQDLKIDTTNLNYNIRLERRLMKNADSLFALLNKAWTKIDTRQLQIWIDSSYRATYFTASSGALSAIKNSLQLKPFAHSAMASYIAEYEDALAGTKALENYQIQNIKEYLESFIAMHFTPVNARSVLFADSVTNSQLRNVKQEDMEQLAVNITLIETYEGTLKVHYQKIKNKAIAFMNYLHQAFKQE